MKKGEFKIFKKIIFGFLVLLIVGGIFTGSINRVLAGVSAPGQSITTTDPGGIMATITQTGKDIASWAKEWAKQAKEMAWKKAGSVAFWSAVRSALNTIAYDTAEWIGTGGEGKKPMFITEGWSEYLTNVADNAAGTYIESMGRAGNFNLCNPNHQLQLQIGLGLVKVAKPDLSSPCTFSKMKENWEAELESPDFLNRFQTMFDPHGNDFVEVLNVHTGLIQAVDISRRAKENQRLQTGGWLDITDIAGRSTGPPGQARSQVEQTKRIQEQSFALNTEDAFEDAANVFLNQLAITLFNRLMSNIGKGKTYTSPYSGNYGLSSFNAGPDYGGIGAAKEKFKKLIEPNFNIRGDYNILGELATCPRPTKAGPTNCVITNKFRKAIEDRLTVGEAMEQGFLSPNGVFGFHSDGLEPNYNEGYPYRSMLILRKFRIIPVGWELAAQYLKDNSHQENLSVNGNLGTGGTKNLQYLINCFDPQDEYGNTQDTKGWCYGLVDPNWVLKAPLNYCKREGPGPELLTEMVIGEGNDSTLTVSRNENYCADEQACIKENFDGSCELYGYCSEERRIWRFGGQSCDPTYNSCEVFRGSEGQTSAYLQNGLNFGNCSVDNSGCRDYCRDYNANTLSFECTNSTGAKLFLDRDAVKCDSGSEGCHEFIRTIPGINANIFNNSSFEDPVAALDQQCDGDAAYGSCAIHLPGNYGPVTVPVFTNGAVPLTEESFTFSVFSKDCGTGGNIYIGSNLNWPVSRSSSTLITGGKWQRFSATHVFLGGDEVIISIEGITDNGCRIDAVKVERGTELSGYDDYRDSGLYYLKLVPDYMADECYVNPGVDYTFRSDAPEICSEFTRLCNRSEVGCKLFTSGSDGLTVPAKISVVDSCPSECVGYDDYLQSETVFDDTTPDYFIPANAKQCSAAVVGCDEFTNLDTIGEGGEEKEYYTYLKQCIRPNDPGANCSNFYTWEGSSETGYQLKSHLFQTSGNEPAVTSPDGAECNSAIYNLPPSDPGYNQDCREYYSQGGQLYYHLHTRTITCGEDCHPYRRSEHNVIRDPFTGANVPDAATCMTYSQWSPPSGGMDWVFKPNGECIVCKNRGEWRADHNACIYQAIPGEGQLCSESQAGCREYTGNTGSNIRIIFNSNFEGGTQGWGGINGTSVINDSESLLIGGESLRVTGGANEISLDIGTIAESGKSYNIRFIAKSISAGAQFDSSAPVYFTNGAVRAVFHTDPSLALTLGAEWRIYELNLAALDHDVDANESIVINATGDFYIDNIRLTEIVNRFYLRKNSWTIPNSCFLDVYGNPAGPLHNLGCSIYYDEERLVYYLRQFSLLCQESAINCELAIDTHNSAAFEPEAWNDGGDGVCDPGDGDACVSVAGDNFVYLVSDTDKDCGINNKGCSRLGLPYKFDGQVVYSEKFLNNDPDSYSTILCDSNGVGCDEWFAETQVKYFKDPVDQVCEWKQGAGMGTGDLSWSWFKKQINRCDDGINPLADVNGKIETTVISSQFFPLEDKICLRDTDCGQSGFSCSADSDCGLYNSCVEGSCYFSCIHDTNDYYCTVADSPEKTIGLGGSGSAIRQPTIDANGFWVGLCPAAESGCTEYIDPLSSFNTNEIYNGDFSQNVDASSNSIPDGWSLGGEQVIDLEANTLYVIAVEDINGTNPGGSNTLTLSASNIAGQPVISFFELVDTNRFMTPVNSIDIIDGGSKRFYTNEAVANANTELLVTALDPTLINGSLVRINKAAISYELKQEIDRGECNGIVDHDKGCVLFNERDVVGGDPVEVDYANLIYDADNSPDPNTGNPVDCNIDACDSNNVLKVTPDRVCSEWLACRSFVKDRFGKNVCFGTGLCDGVDNNGNCDNFLTEKQVNRTFHGSSDVDIIDNSTGYSKVGYSGSSEESDYFPLSSMKQEGEVVYLNNGNFEIFGLNDYPIGWNLAQNNLVWIEDYFKVVDNPVEAQGEGVGFAPEGNSFLKVGAAYKVESDLIEVMHGLDYIISAMINTQNLSDSAAEIIITEYDRDGNVQGNHVELSQDFGLNWTFHNSKFSTIGNPNKTKRIKLTIQTSGLGNIYIDDIQLRPALSAQTGNHVPQTCRLYPEAESLSCDYIEPSGIRKKGYWGYCLDYDRYPGSLDTCIMWWPVDRVKGDGVSDEDIYSGYSGKFPVYYCDNIRAEFTLVEHRKKVKLRKIKKSGWNFLAKVAGFLLGWPGPFIDQDEEEKEGMANNCPAENEGIKNGGYKLKIKKKKKRGLFKDSIKITYYCEPIKSEKVTGHWYEYNGNLVKFEGLDHGGWDETKDGVKIYDPNISAAPFDPKDYNILCSKVWQTVNATGQNKSWTGRVYTGSPYRVAELNYGYGTDDTPFGSLVPPEPVNNPYEWDSSDEGGLQPVNLIGESQGVVRAGSPYSCSGGQCEGLGKCDISGDICYDVPITYPTGIVKDCRVNDKKPCYVNWDQTFLECPDGERCNPDLLNIENTTVDPEEKIKRLFAQSYGTWEWQGTTGYCQANPGTPCTHDQNQCPLGECQARCFMYYAGGNTQDPTTVYDIDDDDNEIDYRTCGNAAALDQTDCIGITWDEDPGGTPMTAAMWNVANACVDFDAECGVGGVNCIADDCCDTLASAPTKCLGDIDLDGEDDNPDCCMDAERQECIDYWQELALAAVISTQMVCDVTHDSCDSSADCAFSTACEWDACLSGENIGKYCNVAQECVNDYCVLASTKAGRYTTPATPEFWNPPEVVCADDAGFPRPRPTWNNHNCGAGIGGLSCFECPATVTGRGTCDFCGVKPTISNITVNGNPGAMPHPILGKNGFVHLTFNSIIEAQQLPLTMYAINWGDNDITVVSGVEMRDRKNPENPHSIFHLYSYWDLKAKNSMEMGAGQNLIYCGSANESAFNNAPVPSSSGVDCPSYSDCCMVQPSVKVKDNWGWCNNGFDNDPCPGGSESGFQLYGAPAGSNVSNVWAIITERR